MLTTIIENFKKSWTRIFFLILGSGSLIWFLVRVLPKPSRAAYPCMKAAAPLASSFVLYLIGISGFTLFFRKARERFTKSKYLMASVLALMGFASGILAVVSNNNTTWAVDLQPPQAGNEPVGEAKGIYPGRVVWVHNPEATDENCTNVEGDFWYQDDNTNTSAVQDMLSRGIRRLTGTTSDAGAWEQLFTYFNSSHGRGEVGYTAGEKIAIKVNFNNVYVGEHGINTSPQIMYALLNQLINVVGVAQSDIGIGDPNHIIEDPYYNKCHDEFPDVDYWNSASGTWVDYTAEDVLFGSDGSVSSGLPLPYIDATYLINVPVFKKHHRAGISITSKNHFGSLGSGAWSWHYSLPVPDGSENDEPLNSEYGVYRCFVDIMGHKDLGGKTVLFLVDGIWGSTNYSHPPIKWELSPFNNDWPNSLFLSQDPVAIESVCFDFLYEEFDEDHLTEGLPVTYDKGPFAHFPGTDDYLHQSADVNNWPDGIDYDPENDGTILSSMGTHEHWNNATDKQYSRNLGTGNGIELYSEHVLSVFDRADYIPEGFSVDDAYPNPFTDLTTISFNLEIPSVSDIYIFNTSGQIVFSQTSDVRKSGKVQFTWDGTSNNGSSLPKGQYIVNIHVTSDRGSFDMSNKVVLQ